MSLAVTSTSSVFTKVAHYCYRCGVKFISYDKTGEWNKYCASCKREKEQGE